MNLLNERIMKTLRYIEKAQNNMYLEPSFKDVFSRDVPSIFDLSELSKIGLAEKWLSEKGFSPRTYDAKEYWRVIYTEQDLRAMGINVETEDFSKGIVDVLERHKTEIDKIKRGLLASQSDVERIFSDIKNKPIDIYVCNAVIGNDIQKRFNLVKTSDDKMFAVLGNSCIVPFEKLSEQLKEIYGPKIRFTTKIFDRFNASMNGVVGQTLSGLGITMTEKNYMNMCMSSEKRYEVYSLSPYIPEAREQFQRLCKDLGIEISIADEILNNAGTHATPETKNIAAVEIDEPR